MDITTEYLYNIQSIVYTYVLAPIFYSVNDCLGVTQLSCCINVVYLANVTLFAL